MITTWYLQSQRTWDKLCHSCIGSSFLPRGAFPEGRAYAVSQRLHAGSLEALRVSRPEAIGIYTARTALLATTLYRSAVSAVGRHQGVSYPQALGNKGLGTGTISDRQVRPTPMQVGTTAAR